MQSRPKILVLGQYFYPAYKAGGSAQSLTNFVAHFRQEYDIAVFTRDRDLGASEPFPLPRSQWHDAGGYRIWYEPLGKSTPMAILRVLRAEEWDVIYANGYVNPVFSFTPRLIARMGLAKGRPTVVLAPRGEFAVNAIGKSPKRKQFYKRVSALLGLHRGIVWQASAEHEAADIIEHVPEAMGGIQIAPDLTPLDDAALAIKPVKTAGAISLAMVARIHPIKNVLFAIETLATCAQPVTFNLYGPKEDAAYWTECEAAIARLPAHINVVWHGPISRPDVAEALRQADAFYMPTHGENFGHSIFEALQAGCPVLISDQTLWRNLAAGKAGHDLPLNDRKGFSDAIDAWAAMGDNEFAAWQMGARQKAADWLENTDGVASNRALMETALEARAK